MSAATTPSPSFAVIGVIGPDSPNTRATLRLWTDAVRPAILVRFAVSIRDRAPTSWWAKAAKPAEPDVDFLDCLGQRSGGGVVIISLFDAWIRHAVAHYPQATFIGRADADAIPSPRWLLALLAAEEARQAAAHSAAAASGDPSPPPLVYAGSMQWYNWDELAYRPWGWGMTPGGARKHAMGENPAACAGPSSARCAGPFPFAAGARAQEREKERERASFLSKCA